MKYEYIAEIGFTRLALRRFEKRLNAAFDKGAVVMSGVRRNESLLRKTYDALVVYHDAGIASGAENKV